MLSSYIEIPRVVNLSQVLHVFTYHNCYPRLRVVMDPSSVDLDEGKIFHDQCSGFYLDDQKYIRFDALPQRGNSLKQNFFSDADLGVVIITRKYHT